MPLIKIFSNLKNPDCNLEAFENFVYTFIVVMVFFYLMGYAIGMAVAYLTK